MKTSKYPHQPRLVAAFLVAFSLATAASAQTPLLFDSFADGAITNGTDNNDALWKKLLTGGSYGPGTVTAAFDTTATTGGDAKQISVITTTNGVSGGTYASFATTTLLVGDKIEASFKYYATVTNQVRFGLYGPDTGADVGKGYFILNNTTPTFSAALDASTVNSSLLSTTGSTFAGTGATSPASGSWITYNLSLTRTSTGMDLAASSSLGGSVSKSFLSSDTGFIDALTTFKVGQTTTGSTVTGFYLDDISVIYTSAVPEPSSYAALAGAAMLGLVALRRRRA